jgi:hypothetical protein
MDRATFWPLIGLPLENTLLALAPTVHLPAAVAAYRANYRRVGEVTRIRVTACRSG